MLLQRRANVRGDEESVCAREHYDEYLAAFVGEVRREFARCDDAKVPSIFGPVSNREQLGIVREFIRDCEDMGYDVVTVGGEDEGSWITPMVVSKPPDESLLVREEQFGECRLQIFPSLYCRDVLY